jgi:methionyl-tRNA formyltransferase
MMCDYQREYPDFPAVTVSRHGGVNAPDVPKLVAREAFDLVLVSGTDLLRQPLIDVITKQGRILNLHTGLSPYIRGGPNCTAWALAIGRFDLIGNTIMWIDAGIDSGDLVATERTTLTGHESLQELNRAVMDHAHDLYAWAVSRFVRGERLRSVRQADVATGHLFLSRHWTATRIASATFNFFVRYSPSSLAHSEPVKLFPRAEGSVATSTSRND